MNGLFTIHLSDTSAPTMKSTDWFAAPVLVLVFFSAPTATAQQAASTGATESTNEESLFDGKTLEGWNGDEKWFRVENGEIIAGSLTEKNSCQSISLYQ